MVQASADANSEVTQGGHNRNKQTIAPLLHGQVEPGRLAFFIFIFFWFLV
jgi:hypothetical protein